MADKAAPARGEAFEQPAKPRARLFRKYAVLFAALVGGALLASGATHLWFSYQENKEALVAVQREKALATASVIEQFVKQIENQIGWTTQAAYVVRAASLDQRRLDYLRLLRQAPAITEVAYLDDAGKDLASSFDRLSMRTLF